MLFAAAKYEDRWFGFGEVGEPESMDEASVRSGDVRCMSESSMDLFFIDDVDELDEVEACRKVAFGRSGAL